jgi:glutathione peroxidase
MLLLNRIPTTLKIVSTTFVAFKLLTTTSIMAAAADQGNPKTAKSVYEFSVNDISGNPVSLEKYRGHVLIVVNVASKCGYTEQHYKELNELYDEYAESKGLRILAFPCNQFASQEPGTNEEISCSLRERKVKFDLFEKIDVNGGDAHPLYVYLKKKQGGTLIDAVKWNFTKFIVDKNGQPVGRYGPTDSPLQIKPKIEKYLDQAKTEL